MDEERVLISSKNLESRERREGGGEKIGFWKGVNE